MAVGDIMLTRGVGQVMREKGFDFPFRRVRKVLENSDLRIGNLESVLATAGEPSQFAHTPWLTFRADPGSVMALKSGGIDLVSVANNHVGDYGKAALIQNCEILRKSGIDFIGAGKNIEEARRPAIYEIKGIKLAVLAYNSLYGRTIIPANKNSAGSSPLFINNVIEDIENVKKKVDFVIVSVHWGIDYMMYPVSCHVDYAHKMIDHGAKIILGHHPHVLQGVEKYNNGIIFYSLGNFVFDEPFEDTKKTAILKLLLSKNDKVSYAFIPAIINKNCQPEIANDNDSKDILNIISSRSIGNQGGVCSHYMRKTVDYDYIKKMIQYMIITRKFTYLKNFPISYFLRYLFPALASKFLKKYPKTAITNNEQKSKIL